MTAEEVFCDLSDKYGDEFNWSMVSSLNRTFVEELKKELGESQVLYNQEIHAVAKCDSNDDVLYLINNESSFSYYIVHLTYSGRPEKDFLNYRRFDTLNEVKEYIEKEFIENYL